MAFRLRARRRGHARCVDCDIDWQEPRAAAPSGVLCADLSQPDRLNEAVLASERILNESGTFPIPGKINTRWAAGFS